MSPNQFVKWTMVILLRYIAKTGPAYRILVFFVMIHRCGPSRQLNIVGATQESWSCRIIYSCSVQDAILLHQLLLSSLRARIEYKKCTISVTNWYYAEMTNITRRAIDLYLYEEKRNFDFFIEKWFDPHRYTQIRFEKRGDCGDAVTKPYLAHKSWIYLVVVNKKNSILQSYLHPPSKFKNCNTTSSYGNDSHF